MIAIVFIGDLKYCPYLTKYTQEIEAINEDYEVLFWAREDYHKEYPDNYHAFGLESGLNKSSISKLTDFYKFRKWLKSKLKKGSYSKVIALSTLSGILINDILIKHYRNRYILDIRDYSYENYKLFYRIEEKLIKNSYFTSISSEGFKSFLPPYENYQLVHNINLKEIKSDKDFKKDTQATLNLVWIGSLRYFEHQRYIIDHLSNDSRFNMIYHGTGPEYRKYVDYCNERKVNNVIFTGEYNNKDKDILLASVHILNNSYSSSKVMEIKYAVSNKYYDGLIYGIPQLVEVATHKYDLVTNSGLGFGIDVKQSDFADVLYEAYNEFQEVSFNQNKREILLKIAKEDETYKRKISEFISLN